MLDVTCITCNPLQENCYIVSDADSREAAIVDCGALYEAEFQAIDNYVAAHALRPVRLLCTHGHFDHVMGCARIGSRYGLLPEVHAADAPLLADLPRQAQKLVGQDFGLRALDIGAPLADGDIVTLGDSRLRVVHTPGHTPGGVCLWAEADHLALTGDTLFRMSVGRTDLDGSSWRQLMDSLAAMAALLPPDTRVLCGHGPQTMMGDELRLNPYLRSAL